MERIAFDTTDAGFVADPYPRYRQLQLSDERHYTPDGLWVLTRYDQVVSVLRDPRWSADPSRSLRAERLEARQVRMPFLDGDGPRIMLLSDPPDHTRLRRLANRAFTPRAVEVLRPRVQEMCRQLLDGVHDGTAGQFDFMAAVALPLPVMVICELLGVPDADRQQFQPWSSAVARVLDPVADPAEVEAAVPAILGFVGYFAELIEARRARPGPDLLSTLIAAEAEGDQLSLPELFGMVILLFIAGHETTTNLLGNGLLALLRHPDQLAQLRDRPDLAGPAVEELLRYDAPVQVTARTASEELTVDDVVVPRGEGVLLGLAAANRDPAYVEEPDRLLLERGRPTHVAFGNGIHHCLGAPLARLEAQVVLPAVLERFDGLELADPHPAYRPHFVLRGLAELPVAWS